MGGSFQNVGDFDSVSAAYPGPGAQDLAIQGTNFMYETSSYPSLSSLHTAYPFGTYTFTAANSSTMTSQSASMNYSADYFTSDIPAFAPSSYTSLQSYNPANCIDGVVQLVCLESQ